MGYPFEYYRLNTGTRVVDQQEKRPQCAACQDDMRPEWVLSYSVNPSGLPGLATPRVAFACSHHLYTLLSNRRAFAPVLVSPYNGF